MVYMTKNKSRAWWCMPIIRVIESQDHGSRQLVQSLDHSVSKERQIVPEDKHSRLISGLHTSTSTHTHTHTRLCFRDGLIPVKPGLLNDLYFISVSS